MMGGVRGWVDGGVRGSAASAANWFILACGRGGWEREE